MDISVRSLEPGMADIFADYFDNLDFSHEPHWATCYCRFYHTSCSHEEWQARPGGQNRQEALEQIASGSMRGYLAFEGDICVGWCNANDFSDFSRLVGDFGSLVQEKKVGCVICFVIHPSYRRSGVARLLLSAAVEGFRSQGYEAVLALPVESADEPEKRYRGTMNMYREQGFLEIKKRGGLSVMWLDL